MTDILWPASDTGYIGRVRWTEMHVEVVITHIKEQRRNLLGATE